MGVLFVSKQVQEERLNTCRNCPLVVVNGKVAFPRDTIFQKLLGAIKDMKELECSVCGCPTKIRAKQAIVGCPKGRWRR